MIRLWILCCIFLLGLLNLCQVFAASNGNFSGFIDIVSISAEAGGTHNGMPAHYKDKEMNLSVYVHLNESWLESGFSAQLVVRVKIPNNNGIEGQVCDGVNVDGTDHGCTTSSAPVYDYYFTLDKSRIFTKTSDDIQIGAGYPVVSLEGEYDVKVDFGRIYLLPVATTTTTSSPGATYTSDIDINIEGVMYAKQRSRQSSYTFTAEAEWTDNNSGSPETLNSTVDTTLIGPDLTAYYSQTYSDGTNTAQAGDTVANTLTIDHSPYSTENAYDLHVTMLFDTTQSDMVANSSEYGLNPPGTMKYISQFDLMLNGGITVNMTLSEELRIRYTLKLTDYLSLNSKVWTRANIDFTSSGYTSSYNLVALIPISAKSITFQSDASDKTLPANLAVGETHPIKKSFLMPLGKVGLEFFADINTSNGLNENPLTFNGLTMSSNDTNLVFVPGAKRKKRSLAHSRTKRAVDNVIVDGGTVTNPSATGTSNAPVRVDLNAVVVDVNRGGTIGVETGFLVNSANNKFVLSSNTGKLSKPILKINQTVEYIDTTVLPTKVRFNLTVSHEVPGSNADALTVALKSGSSVQEIFWADRGSSEGPMPWDSELTVQSNVIWTWSKNSLAQADEMFMSYPSIPTDSMATGTTNFSATVSWKASAGSMTFTEIARVCLEKIEVRTSTLATEWGFTVLALLFGLIVGALIVFLILYIIIRCCKRMPMTSVRPASAVDEQKIKEASEGHGLLLSAPKKKGFNTIKDLSGVGEEESIVGVLAKRDRLKINRDLDTWDILNTINIDTEIENERDDAMMNATLILMRNLEGNGDIDKGMVDRSTQKFRKSLSDLNRKMDDDYKREIDEIYKRLSAKNQERLADLLAKQQDEEEDLREQTKDLPPKEQEYLMELLKEQHATERSELSYRLKLEQDEETEKLRKEYSIKKRIGIKDAQQTLLDEVKTQGKFGAEQAEWLMKEHFKNQAAIEKIYDDEISRQRMALEEKLARRRALAQEHDQQEEFQSEALNTIAAQQMGAISKMRKEGVIHEQEARAMIEQAEKDMITQKKKMDQDRAKHEQDLHKKLSERKKKRRAEVAKKHAQERKDLEKKHQELQKKDGFCDPISALQEKQSLISQQRAEMTEVENDLDKEHSRELLELREQLGTGARNNLLSGKGQTLDKLKSNGASEAQIDKLLRKHESEIARLEEHQQDERLKQEEHFKKQLAKRRQQASLRREEERREQEQLREHEDNVVRKLMDNQVAMSEEERERIMAEHEKQMVKLENSLTLNKLQQKRMLEEKLAQKRARQLEKLQKKQNMEAKKTMRKADRDSDMDEQDKYHTEMDLLRKHAEQRVAVMQGENIQLEDELEEIRVEMMKERASSLKEQEVRLGAMMAQLQMEKAKEMAKIEEQQKAIHNLKSNLMDDLNDKGILSDPECQRVIEAHQREQEKLTEKLESQRAKQERALRARLEQRLQQKEQQMSQLQEDQLKEAVGRANTPAAKIRRVAMKQKHMLEMEKFRNRMEKEIEQSLQEMRRQSELRRMKMVQEQELQFINGLVRLGKFNADELKNVVQLLFPNKSEEETKKLMDTMCEGYEARPSSRPDEIDLNSSLVHRVKSESLRRGSAALTAEQMAARSSNKKKPQRGRTGSRSFTPDQPPPNRLAPLKKKKKPRKASAANSEDELYQY